MQVTIEACTLICVNILQKAVKKLIKREYPESTRDETYQYTFKELKKFTANEQFFEYEALSNYLGGHRWFFKCPKCHNRASKLFLPPVGYGKEQKYLCKSCHKLKNQSALMGQNNMYRKVTRPLKRMKEIEEKVARGHLKNEKVQELLNEYENLEKELKTSPEFRLYSFKKKHNLI